MPILVDVCKVRVGTVAGRRAAIVEHRLMDRPSANVIGQRDLKTIDAAIKSRKKALAKHAKVSGPDSLAQLNAKKADIMKFCGIFRRKKTTKPSKKGFKRVG